MSVILSLEGHRSTVHCYIHLIPLVSTTDRGPSNTTSASAPGEALIKVLLGGTVAMAMLVLSTDRSLPWRNESLGKIGSSQDR